MAKSRQEVERLLRLVENIARDARAEVLREIRSTETDLDAALQAAAATVAVRVTRIAGARWNPAQVDHIIKIAFVDSAPQRAQLVAQLVESSAAAGAAAAESTHVAVFGKSPRRLPPGGHWSAEEVARVVNAQVAGVVPLTATPEQVADIARGRRRRVAVKRARRRAINRRIARREPETTYPIRPLTLSARFHQNADTIRQALVRELSTSMRANESVIQTAQRLLRTEDVRVEIPRYITEIRDAAKLGGDALKEAIRDHSAQINRLGQAGPGGDYTIRGATKKFIREVRGASAADIEAATDRWIVKRARYQERLVARTEAMRALSNVYAANSSERSYTKGQRWKLGSGHPHADVCDVYANQDLHGLGAGGYPPGSAPVMPLHPADLCYYTAIVDVNHFERESARKRGLPEPPRPWESGERVTGAEWLARQPESRIREMLGRRRARVFAEDPDRVLTPSGDIRPVYQVMGEAKPETRRPREAAIVERGARVRRAS